MARKTTKLLTTVTSTMATSTMSAITSAISSSTTAIASTVSTSTMASTISTLDEEVAAIKAMSVRERIGVKTVVIYGFELPLILIGLIMSVAVGTILKNTRCFHQNLRFLMLNFVFGFVLVILSRFAIILPSFLSYAANLDLCPFAYSQTATHIHDVGLYVVSLNIIAMVLERTWATVYVRRYENVMTPVFGAVLITLMWVFAAIYTAASTMVGEPSQVTPYLVGCQQRLTNKNMQTYFLGALFALDATAMLMFFILLCVNRSRYKEAPNGSSIQYALSFRYQLAENIRTTKLLFPLVLTYISCSFIAVILLTMAAFQSKNLPLFERYMVSSTWGQSFDIMFAIGSIGLPNVVIFGHPSLRRDFRKMIQTRMSRRCRAAPSRMPQVKAVNGDRLIRTASEEQAISFQNLNDMWNVGKDKEDKPKRSFSKSSIKTVY